LLLGGIHGVDFTTRFLFCALHTLLVHCSWS
jgi:hypothetical protein